jgi:hypothetical protein
MDNFYIVIFIATFPYLRCHHYLCVVWYIWGYMEMLWTAAIWYIIELGAWIVSEFYIDSMACDRIHELYSWNENDVPNSNYC